MIDESLIKYKIAKITLFKSHIKSYSKSHFYNKNLKYLYILGFLSQL